MLKRICIMLLFFMFWAADVIAQTNGRRNIYTSPDGAIQVELPRHWRFGTISPNAMQDYPPVSEAPTAYRLTLIHSQPSVEITLSFIDVQNQFEADSTPAAAMVEQIEQDIPELLIELESLVIGEQEAYRALLQALPDTELALGEHIRITEPQTVYFLDIRQDWLLLATWQPQDATINIEEDLLAIIESVLFNGATRHITTLSGDIELNLPDSWYRSRNVLDRSGNEELNLFSKRAFELWSAGIEILPANTRNYSFPDGDVTLEDYLLAYIAGVRSEQIDIISVEHLETVPESLMARVESDAFTQFIGLMHLDDGRIIVMRFTGDENDADAALGDFLEIMNGITVADSEE